MAGQATTFGENLALDTLLNGVYLALFTVTPTDAGGGTEVAGNGYARQACAFDAAAAGTAANTAEELFTAVGGDWGTITHWALFDAVSGGNMIFYGSWDVAKLIENGDTFRVAAGALDIGAE